MRGEDTQQNAMFSYLSPEQRVPQDHPVRRLRRLVDEVLRKLSRRFSGGIEGRPPCAYIAVKRRDSFLSTASTKRRSLRTGWS